MREISHSSSPHVAFNAANVKHTEGLRTSGESNAAPPQDIASAMFGAHSEYSVAHDSMDVLHTATETATSLGCAGKLDALGSGVSAAGILSGLYFGVSGVRDLNKAIKDKNVTNGIEAGGHMLLGGEAAIDAARLAVQSSAITNMIGPVATGILQSPAMKMLGTAFGMAHGVVESGVGIKEIYDGYKAHDKSHIITGILDVAAGASVAAIAIGGGPIAGIALAVTFGLQMLRHYH